MNQGLSSLLVEPQSHFPTPSPGPSLEVPDELFLFRPLAHPEFVGDDVAGMDAALGTGPARWGGMGGGRRTVTSPQAGLQAHTPLGCFSPSLLASP